MNKIIKKVLTIAITLTVVFGVYQVDSLAATDEAGNNNSLLTRLVVEREQVRPGDYFDVYYEVLNGSYSLIPKELDTVEIRLPAEAKYEGAVIDTSFGTDDEYYYNIKSHTIYYSPKKIAMRSKNYIRISMVIPKEGRVGDQLEVTAIAPNGSGIKELSVQSPTITSPVFEGVLESNRAEDTLIGDTVEYQLNISNTGNWKSEITYLTIYKDPNFILDQNTVKVFIDGQENKNYQVKFDDKTYGLNIGPVAPNSNVVLKYEGTIKNEAFQKTVVGQVDVQSSFRWPSDPIDTGYIWDASFNDNNDYLVTKVVNIIYNNNDATGGGMLNGEAIYGKPYSLATNSYTKTGYEFKGWTTTPGGQTVDYTDEHQFTAFNLENDLDLYPVWKIADYAITYNGNGSTAGTMTNGVANYGQKLALSKNAFERDGYTFKGWSTKTDGQVEYTDGQVFDPWNQDKGLDLYAVWEANEYTITYHDTGATSGSMDADTVTYDDNFTLAANQYEKFGYDFKGWSDQENGQVVYCDVYKFLPYNELNGLDLYPVWSAKTVTVTYDGNGATSGNMTSDPAVFDQSVTLTPNAYTRTGYSFKGWATSADGDVVYADGYTFTKWDREFGLKIYAVWSPNTYAITYHGNGETSGTMDQGTLTFDEKNQLAKNAYEKTGHTFEGWALTPNGKVEYTNEEVLDAWNQETGLELYAVWSVCDYNVAYHGNGATKGSMTSDVATYNQPITLAKNTHERKGYTFMGWATSKDGDVEYTDEHAIDAYLLTNHLDLYAIWNANTYTITYDGNGATTGSMDQGTVTFDNKAVLAKNTYEKAGYVFKGWATSKDSDVLYKDEQAFDVWNKDSDVKLFAVWEVKQNPSIDTPQNNNNDKNTTNTTNKANNQTSPTNNVQSGDTTSAITWIACLMVSLGAIVILRKRKSLKK
ncbi:MULTISPECIES: InlB B-repeat-containing protein [unclassified Breznakia]|uniref:InlB B-repeat-containing protein n=1 Tax=unclassified Breznakia TaxID=2623764 RepID=UPI002475AD56|nr:MULTISPECIES: InlB B-repeat-containing protein [unclassified Breznakia]MDH6367937.1 putative repeat protein (TIGR02543 family) [Breznakia sp. PH1-1]MDH6405025.1 putative repeat protein (TIGR02543 family) [Breznakia sp. PF1-11]MDH6412740.1 putative repeat protein (TIGR02543 family) [Breznakia sp. PFB1-11]MDH6415123.1 putative repeat protein (TIGR02543 family) [Breznakia sp. PFB1-14]MDH6417411.1 putative repeat protein (TIGR02543 family) [Breznakia sp. PFB1-4]